MNCNNRFKKSRTAKGVRLLAALLLGVLAGGLAAVPALAATSTFTVSGSWTAPEGVTSVMAEVWGAGGGGGGGVGAAMGGSGGGGGGYAKRNSLSVTPGNSYNVTVGLGGTGMPGASGTSGGQSFFIDGPTLSAMGGMGGGTNGSSPGTGGTGGPGDIMYGGGLGANGTAGNGGGGGSSAGRYQGGNSAGGISGAGAPIDGGPGGDGSSATNGNMGTFPPGGGGGGAYKNGGLQGGNGRNGQVVITPLYPVPENLMPNNVQESSFYLTWTTTGNLRGYLVEASTAPDFTGEVLGGQSGLPEFNFSGLTPNTTYHIRVGSLWAITTYYAPVLPVITRIEPPGSVFIDEVSSWSITASVYGSTFTNLGAGMSGADLALDNAYTGVWTANSGSWTELSPIPWVKRAQAAAVALEGQIYLVGGVSGGSPVNANQSNYRYTLQPPGWTMRGDLNVYRYGLSAAALGGKIYAVGGLNVGGLSQKVNEAYDPATNSWSTMAPMPTARSAFGLAALNGRLYAVGGDDGAGYNKTEVYEPASNSWSTGTNLTTPRWGLALVALNNRLYAVGGYKPTLGYSDDNEEYNPDTKVWTPRARLPWARRNLSAAVVGGKVYAIGGYDGTNLQKRADVYETGSNTWSAASPLPAARENAAAVALGGRIYLLGGFNLVELASATVYNPGVTKVFTGLQPNRQYSLKGKTRNQIGLESTETGGPQIYTLAYATVPEGGMSSFSDVGDRWLSVRWSSGSLAGGYTGAGATFEVQAATSSDFRGEVRWYSTSADYQYFSDLRDKTTYFVRVLAKNSGMQSDYAWTLLGSTRTAASPLAGAVISSVTAYSSDNSNWSRSAVRDSQGKLYIAYLKKYGGKNRVFISSSSDNGLNWTVPPLPIDGLGGVHDQLPPALAIDSRDGLHLAWGQTGAPMGVYHSSASAPGYAWSANTQINPGINIAEGPFNIAVDSKDGLHLAWSSKNCGGGGCYRVRYSSRSAAGNWTPIVTLGTDGNGADHAALAVDASDGVHLVARHAISPAVDFSESIAYSSRSAYDTFGGWSGVYTDNGYDQGAPALTIKADGQLFAAWHSVDLGHPGPQIKYAVKPPVGAWSGMAYAAADALAAQRDPSAAADALGNVYVLWSGSDSLKPAVNLKGSVFDGTVWDTIDELTDEATGYQLYTQLRWAGWRNNGGGIDVIWNSYDGSASTMVLRAMQGPDVPMSPGWSVTAWPLPPGCGFALNVRKDGTGDFRGIQQALAAVPTEVSTNSCVVVRDTQTYSEQVTVQGFRYRWETPARLIIMSDPAFVSSAPVVIPPFSSQAAFRLYSASVTVQGFTIISTNTISYGIFASSDSAVISSVNVVGETINGIINTDGIRVSSRSLVQYSSVTVHWANGINLDGSYNEVAYSTAVSAFNTHSALRVFGSNNSVGRSYFHNSEGNSVYLNFAHGNTISYTTMTGVMSNFGALYLNGSDFNTINDSYMYSRDGYGATLYNMSDFNSIQNSTMASANSGSSRGLFVYNSSTNTVSASRVLNEAGLGASFEWNSFGNSVFASVISASGTYLASALSFSNADGNSVRNSFINSYDGNGVDFFSGADYNTISYSTITSGGSGFYHAGLYVNSSATTTVVSSYIQGSTAAYISNSGLVMLRDSVFKATNTAGSGLYLTGATQGLFAASSTFSGGALGPALQLGNSNLGKVELSSTVIAGGQYGMFVSVPGGSGLLRISSMTFRTLSPNATAVYFTEGLYDQNNSYWEYLDFASGNIDVNVNGQNLYAGSNVFMAHPEGKWGALYELENGANNYVHWPTSNALLMWPADNAVQVSPAPALRAMTEWGSTVAQYRFQLDSDQYMAAPARDFDQASLQLFPPYGTFSGQDGNYSAVGDSFLYNSTATFFFSGTGGYLLPNTQYFWRAKVKTPESGEYGQWTATSSFTTGELASETPANNLAVTQVALSSPTSDGVSVSFRIRENNLVQSFTAQGGIYNTADWIFVKFSTATGVWNHATLTGGQVEAGATLATVSDKKGVFLDHTNTAAYWTAGATVTWKYADDGVLGGNAMVKVFAVSMVRVPMGGFRYNVDNLGGTGVNNIAGPKFVDSAAGDDLPSGAAAGWPNGYNPFYMMRYEITQGQYANFLNTIPTADAAARYSSIMDRGHSMTYTGFYEASDRFAAKNYLSTTDIWSFLSWAGLRPPTEMEFEKAARDLGADARVYPWGSESPDAASYSPPNEGGTHYKHYMNYYFNSSGKVIDSGRYLSGDVFRTPAQTGASPYGIADLAGNVSEYVINCSHSQVPGEGNGTLAWPSSWPAVDSAAKGLRGGNMDDASQNAKVSNRVVSSYSFDSRSYGYGGRGVRTAP